MANVNLTGRAKEVFETVEAFKQMNITAKDLANDLNITTKTASKYLSQFAKQGLIQRVDRGVYTNIVSEDDNTETETNANDNTETETNANDNTATEAPANDAHDIYINGSYVSTLSGTVESITETIRVANPGVILDRREGGSVYFIEQAGTKG